MFKHVLLPTDGSPIARKAIKAGIALAKTLGARVTAYHAIDAIPLYSYSDGYLLSGALLKEFDKRAREQGDKYLAEVEKAAKAARVPCGRLMSKPATAHEGIVAAAKKQRCDAIFMASHGRGELGALLLGSVTQKVLAHTKLPVLVYR
ncbi:MAG: universal stress protein [Burkholderiales bacterium]